MSEQKVVLKENKLSMKTSWLYGMASVSDALPYNFVLTFFLFYLTDIVGIGPALAGAIILVSTLMDGFFGPISGYFCENVSFKSGRRRPVFMVAAIPLGISVIAMFTNVEFSDMGKNIFYMFFAILFWLSYAFFYTAYTAFGAEITSDYDERVKLRLPATIMQSVGNIFAMSLPLTVIVFFQDLGLSESSSWTAFAAIVGVLTTLMVFVTWKGTKGIEKPLELNHREDAKKENFFKLFANIIKIKSYRYVMIIAVLFSFFFGVKNSIFIYFAQYNIGLSEGQISIALFCMVIFAIVSTVFLVWCATKVDKNKVVIAAFLFTGVMSIIFKFLEVGTLEMALLYLGLTILAGGAYWQFIPTTLYDISEIYEFKYGERREAAIVSLNSFAQSVGGAIGIQTLGILLQVSGYDGMAEVQSDAALTQIEDIATYILGIISIVIAFVYVLLPITKKRYDKMMIALEKKRNGEEFETEEFEKMI